MQLSPLNWQLLTLEQTFILSDSATYFFDFQTQAQQAIEQLDRNEYGSALILKSDTLPDFFAEISRFCKEKEIAHSISTDFNAESLFGYSIYLEQQNKIEHITGIIQQAEHSILILNLNTLLADLSQWDKLKQALLYHQYQPYFSKNMPQVLPLIDAHFKLILVGSREDIATLFNYDDSLYHFCQYAEIESYLKITNETRNQWGNYVQSFAQQCCGKHFSDTALNQLLHHYIRESENQTLISISPTLLRKYCLGLSYFYPKQVEFDEIQGYFDYLDAQSARLHRFALEDMLSHQLHILTDGEIIGQINGLSVVEFDGVPLPFGEPVRISCNIQHGDGEIHDIERKVELGGNIHSKGIFIAQSCLANLLELPTQLPFSASIAFEQSYGEIDGDSSSLAILSALVSALSKLPLPQTIAVTGAIDQLGNVLSVGGVNYKIEGFFELCQARGLNGKQGVIIPSACLSHLSLKPVVLEAIKSEQFHIWAVSTVAEALELLLAHPVYDEENVEHDLPSLFSLVHQSIQTEETSGSFWQKICKKLFH